MTQLCEEIEDLSERPKDHQHQLRNGSELRTALVQFGDWRVKLLSHVVTRVGNFFANAYQRVCATFGQTQRRKTVHLMRCRSILTVVPRGRFELELTSTISTASHIFNKVCPTSSRPGTGTKCKKSTPAKSASCPTRAAAPRTPAIASMARYPEVSGSKS